MEKAREDLNEAVEKAVAEEMRPRLENEFQDTHSSFFDSAGRLTSIGWIAVELLTARDELNRLREENKKLYRGASTLIHVINSLGDFAV